MFFCFPLFAMAMSCIGQKTATTSCGACKKVTSFHNIKLNLKYHAGDAMSICPGKVCLFCPQTLLKQSNHTHCLGFHKNVGLLYQVYFHSTFSSHHNQISLIYGCLSFLLLCNFLQNIHFFVWKASANPWPQLLSSSFQNPSSVFVFITPRRVRE